MLSVDLMQPHKLENHDVSTFVSQKQVQTRSKLYVPFLVCLSSIFFLESQKDQSASGLLWFLA